MNIHDLYKKVSDFEAQISSEALAFSQCKKGCSKCCYTDISVFEVEAGSIRNWFSGLSTEQKKNLLDKWNNPPNEGACALLHEESCTIYEARPLICRTQGLAMTFKDEAQQFIDVCPLNEDMLDVLQESEFLNLDLLNMILSQIEKLDSKDIRRERVKLSSLRNFLWTESQKL